LTIWPRLESFVGGADPPLAIAGVKKETPKMFEVPLLKVSAAPNTKLSTDFPAMEMVSEYQLP
jgi:hypothetical protein